MFGIHQAFSLAVAQVFLIGVGTTIVALVVSTLMQELPLRKSFGAAHEAEHAATGGATRTLAAHGRRSRAPRPTDSPLLQPNDPASLVGPGRSASRGYHRP